MDIYQLLKKDHEEAKQLFKKLHSGKGERKELFSELSKELTVHMEGEEKLFYPLLKENEETRDITMEGYEEHNEAKQILKQIKSVKDDNEWKQKLQELQKSVEHHIEEEEHELFKHAKKVLGAEKAAEIGQAFQKEKQQKMGK
jgi:hemerythrin superfamily protein